MVYLLKKVDLSIFFWKRLPGRVYHHTYHTSNGAMLPWLPVARWPVRKIPGVYGSPRLGFDPNGTMWGDAHLHIIR